MNELNIDTILKAASSPELSGNMESILHGMDEMQKIMDRFDKLMQTVDRLGFKEILVRSAGVKMGVDPESPLKSAKIVFIPTSPYHETVYNQLNSLSEEQIAQILVGGVQSVENSEVTELEDATPDNKSTKSD